MMTTATLKHILINSYFISELLHKQRQNIDGTAKVQRQNRDRIVTNQALKTTK